VFPARCLGTSRYRMAVSRALLASLALLLSAAAALGGSLSAKGNYEFSSGGDKTYSGDITYYGAQNSRGFGHCSYHFSSFGNLPAFKGTPLAINNAQYTGVSVSWWSLCVPSWLGEVSQHDQGLPMPCADNAGHVGQVNGPARMHCHGRN
jgi:hypothetical protein